MNNLRIGIFAAIFINIGNVALATTCDLTDQGVFTNPALDGKFNRAQVTVTKESKDMMAFEVVIPCGTKLTPTVLSASCEDYKSLKVRDQGSSQCSLGSDPRISISGEKLTIYTDIRVPDFNGRYEFYR